MENFLNWNFSVHGSVIVLVLALFVYEMVHTHTDLRGIGSDLVPFVGIIALLAVAVAAVMTTVVAWQRQEIGYIAFLVVAICFYLRRRIFSKN